MNSSYQPKIILCLPTLGQYTKEYLISLMTTITPQNPFVGFIITETSLLPFSRNQCIKLAYEKHPDLTHIIFIDDDMTHFGLWHIAKLVQDDKDIVSAIMTFRSPPYSIVGSFDDNSKITEYCENKQLVRAHYTGMAFTLIKREVLDALKEETHNGPIWFTMDREPRKSFENEKLEFIDDLIMDYQGKDTKVPKSLRKTLEEAIAFGQTSHIGTDISGEDISFCNRAKKLGFEVWIDCEVIVSHVGGDIPFNICNQHQYKEAAECKLQIVS